MHWPALLHYSPAEKLVHHRRYTQDRTHFKPCGLWLSDGDEWRRWCESVGFGCIGLTDRPFDDRGVNVFRVFLVNDARVRWLRSPEDIRAFHNEFRGASRIEKRYVDWGRVAAEWDGVLISPYQRDCRSDNDMSWYYSWDVSSACVWDWRAIERVERITV